MVGVPGKFKGCETCRLRRVRVSRLPVYLCLPGCRDSPVAADEAVPQCDNNRPFCNKCLDSGRDCAGYERETVFIIGTLEDGGRCSSHPPRVVKSKKAKASSSKTEARPETLELFPSPPLQPAWDGSVSLTNGETTYDVRIAALHTSLQGVRRLFEDASDSKFGLSFPPYSPTDVRPFAGEEDFTLRYHSMVYLPPDEDTSGQSSGTTTPTDSIYLFLYEVRRPASEAPLVREATDQKKHNSSVTFSSLPPWKDPTIRNNSVRQLGPEGFRSFPSHHYFVRLFRHNAVGSSGTPAVPPRTLTSRPLPRLWLPC